MTLRTRAQSLVDALALRNLQRFIRSERAGLIDFASNDYLGLSRRPSLREAMRSTSVVGSGGARLLSGAHPEHAALEADLARFVGRERALLFSSGYLAALGAVQALAPLVAAAYSDEHNHASLIDGLRLTKLPRTIFAHGALPSAQERTAPALVVTESVFGMSGEAIDLAGMLERLGPGDVLVLDEAHALGIYGQRGSGLASAFDDERIVIVGTLSKAFGCAGGFVAGTSEVIDLLISTARSFIFDTSMPPPLAAAARAALEAIVQGEALRGALQANVQRLCRGLRAIDRFGGLREAPIIPLIVGDARSALDLGEHLRAQGIFAPAIRPPTVAQGQSQIRLVVRADHTASEIAALLCALASAPQAVS
jgi:8-amino-7-oxononanoate synthase